MAGGGIGQKWAAVLLIVALWGTCSAQTCDEGDLKVLQTFRDTFEDPGGVFSTWNGTDCCTGWEGVECASSGRVVSLEVQAPHPRYGPNPTPKPGFTGIAAASLTDLTALQTLRVVAVFFNSPLPDTFGNLAKLETLEFGLNNLTGTIPASIGEAKNLKSLTINVNMPFPEQDFTGGPIPESFCDLTKLEIVALAAVRFTGKIPSCICRWRQATSIDMAVNSLVSEIPNCIGYTLDKLTYLGLDYNNFTGPVPAMLGRLKSLEELKLNNNQFSGKIPASLGSLEVLRSLSLSENSLFGPIPASFGKLQALVFLDLANNYLTSIPKELGLLGNLTYVNLQNNKLLGALPEEIGNAGINSQEGLQLDISNNILSGRLPFTLGLLGSFIASNNYFHGAFPLSLAGVPYVELNNNFLSSYGDSGPAPAEFVIRVLELQNNRFAGHIPAWLTTLLAESRLITEVDISQNKFSGDVGALLLNLPELRLLNASHNLFHSKLPATTFNTSDSYTLDLSHNDICGSIPLTFFPSLASSQYIDMSYNNLTGPLPDNVGQLDNISYLDLSHNMLSGKVPQSIDQLRDTLQFLDLSHNDFVGDVPEIQNDNTVTFK
ncbi:hypothetical protein MPTK1_4g21430 [Marchantia polymorpha subsp. ruderalis]|nr:hypothetical protein MARPO_0090s0078 [Marchantia polymorpha]BBN09642.1 hypothetical protein Mp_4g21430 [Marchantia polymorpha subsp. ruderalis]|eukprot:PTQ33344.1 hypothetical protein MARPO_0090s0078 [Marchantia polymorpha]